MPMIAVLLLAGVLLLADPGARGSDPRPSISPEVGYVAYSPLGLLGGGVVPASCESGFAHFAGQCGGGGGGGFLPPTVDLKINGSDGPITFEALAGYNATWATNFANSCTASGSWSGGKPISGSESFTDVPRGTYTYTLTCDGAGGQTSDAVQVNVIQVPQCTFAPNPGSIILPETATLFWSCQFADSCAIDQGIGSVNPVSGNREVQPQQTTLYTLTCQGADGGRSYPGTVRVFSPSLKEILPKP